MIHAVIDTNVLVSALITKNPEAATAQVVFVRKRERLVLISKLTEISNVDFKGITFFGGWGLLMLYHAERKTEHPEKLQKDEMAFKKMLLFTTKK